MSDLILETPFEFESSAQFSPCRRYRYTLWRRWAPGPYAMFIGLNPSSAGGIMLGELCSDHEAKTQKRRMVSENISVEKSQPDGKSFQLINGYSSGHIQEIRETCLGLPVCLRCGQERSSREFTDEHREIMWMLTHKERGKSSVMEGRQKHRRGLHDDYDIAGWGVGNNQGASVCDGAPHRKKIIFRREYSPQEREQIGQRDNELGALDESAAMRTKGIRFSGFRPADPRSLCFACQTTVTDETQDDPTIRRCINFSKAWGYSAFLMTNIFAFRATDPQDMKAEPEPIGESNDAHLMANALGAGVVVAAWGVHGVHLGRHEAVFALISDLHCLGVTREGHPRHPLYMPGNSKPVPFNY